MKIKERLRVFRNFIIKSPIGGLMFLVSILLILVVTLILSGDFNFPETDFSEKTSASTDNCSVKGIELHGSLLTYIPKHSEYDTYFNYDTVASQDVVWLIKQANKKPEVKAILIEVDSGGGSPMAGEEISKGIKNSEKPIVAIIREVGASSSYWAISSADKIFASKNSDIGGIGITSSYLNNVEKNKKEGYAYEQLSVGKYKDAGSPDRALTKEEKALFLENNNVVYDNFVETISVNRKIPIEKVRELANGFTVLGEKAKSLGLIDEIGGINEVEKYLEEKIGGKPEICW